MFEITEAHVLKLDDKQLRELVVQLAAAELRTQGLPVSGITAGGNQNAPDGGIDVRVELQEGTPSGFVPRALTGLQVKSTDMSASDIAGEMRPGGVLRQTIADIVVGQGAYIIVSSKGSVADQPLLDRRAAMRRALSDADPELHAFVDFYDRVRLADWANEHAGVSLWVRQSVGDPLSGWKPFGHWSGSAPETEYLADQTGRVTLRTAADAQAVSAVDGIALMRAALKKEGGIVRLVGLSGVGKTRLAQALFQERVSEGALDQASVAYTDEGTGPVPAARDFLYALAAKRRRVIVIVDNCNPSLHRELARIVVETKAPLSLLTIEYDVSDDEPEETEVFELSPSSQQVLDGLLAKLTPEVSHVDRQTIAELAGGNARVALALARTLRKGETLGVLNDLDVFKRLFIQGNAVDPSLLRAAQAFSLVYSFDGDTVIGPATELALLASITGQSVDDLYGQIDKLRRRDLVQSRGRWRALLPHALANRLAGEALTVFPLSTMVPKLQENGRLFKSFSRRFGYLHNSKEARDTAIGWLETGEQFFKDDDLFGHLWAVFANIAPLAPTQALAILVRVASGPSGDRLLAPSWPNRARVFSLVRSLAYDADLFDPAARLLLRFAIAKPDDKTATTAWKELFQRVGSGTHASLEQRAALLRSLFAGGRMPEAQLAIEGVGAMLESTHFTSNHSYSFGARPRDHGWTPKGVDQVNAWYATTFALTKEIADEDLSLRKKMLEAFAQRIRNLSWTLPSIEELTAVIRSLARPNGWPGAWSAVRAALKFHRESMAKTRVEALEQLERDLRPQSLLEEARAYVLLPAFGILDLADIELDTEDSTATDPYEAASRKAAQLGAEFANQPALLEELLPELLSTEAGRQYEFGRGLGSQAADPSAVWQTAVAKLAEVEPTVRSVQVLCGLLAGATDQASPSTKVLLDAAVTHPVLGEFFPHLQQFAMDSESARRIEAALNAGIAPARQYIGVLTLRHGQQLSEADYSSICLRVLQMPNGFGTAIFCLSSRLHWMRAATAVPSSAFQKLGRAVLERTQFGDRTPNLEYNISEVAKACLAGPDGAASADLFCAGFAAAVSGYDTPAHTFETLAALLLEMQPAGFLNAFVTPTRSALGRSVLSSFSESETRLLDSMNEDAILSWASVDPAVRVPAIAEEVTIVHKDADGSVGWSGVAKALLAKGPDQARVLEAFERRFEPTSWSGSLAVVLRPYQELTAALASHNDPAVSAWAKTRSATLAERVAQDQWSHRQADESFE